MMDRREYKELRAIVDDLAEKISRQQKLVHRQGGKPKSTLLALSIEEAMTEHEFEYERYHPDKSDRMYVTALALKRAADKYYDLVRKLCPDSVRSYEQSRT